MNATQQWMRDDVRRNPVTLLSADFLDDLDDADELTFLQDLYLADLWFEADPGTPRPGP